MTIQQRHSLKPTRKNTKKRNKKPIIGRNMNMFTKYQRIKTQKKKEQCKLTNTKNTNQRCHKPNSKENTRHRLHIPPRNKRRRIKYRQISIRTKNVSYINK